MNNYCEICDYDLCSECGNCPICDGHDPDICGPEEIEGGFDEHGEPID